MLASTAGLIAGCGGAAGGQHGSAGGVPVSTAAVVRADVAESQEVTGSLGYAGSDDVIASGQGTLTWPPAVGQVVRRGQAAYEVDGVGVPLL